MSHYKLNSFSISGGNITTEFANLSDTTASSPSDKREWAASFILR